MSAARQLDLFAAEAPAVARTLADLVTAIGPAGRLPMWAAMAGEAWFQRAWLGCARYDVLADLVALAFGRDLEMESGPAGDWFTSSLHERCFDEADPDDCARCADRTRAHVGHITLEMVRLGLEERR